MTQATLPFDLAVLPEPGALELQADMRLWSLLKQPELWPGHGMFLSTGDPALVEPVAQRLAEVWDINSCPQIIQLSGFSFPHEPDAFVALSAAERREKHVLVIAPVMPQGLEIALPDLHSRVLGIATVSLPEAGLQTIEQVLRAYLAAIGLEAAARDIEHAAVLLPARLSAVRQAVIRLNNNHAIARHVSRSDLLSACLPAGAGPEGEEGA